MDAYQHFLLNKLTTIEGITGVALVVCPKIAGAGQSFTPGLNGQLITTGLHRQVCNAPSNIHTIRLATQ